MKPSFPPLKEADCSFIDCQQVFSANITEQKTAYTVWRPEGNLEFSLESEYRRIVSILRGQELENENAVYAKMPGKIVKILAKPGDAVEKGVPVMVMEAMKMENEIRAPLTGKALAVCVKEGQAVETGTLLMELETESSDWPAHERKLRRSRARHGKHATRYHHDNQGRNTFWTM